MSRAGREHLEPGGLDAQWLPLSQLSREEFATIARTLAQVLPQRTPWRGNVCGPRPIALLLGSVDAGPRREPSSSQRPSPPSPPAG